MYAIVISMSQKTEDWGGMRLEVGLALACVALSCMVEERLSLVRCAIFISLSHKMGDFWGIRLEVCLALSDGRSKTVVRNVYFCYTCVAKDKDWLGTRLGVCLTLSCAAYICWDRRKAVVTYVR
jgi:hypothetical protein